jgi:hypothetical protein
MNMGTAMAECAIEWSRPFEQAAIQARDPVALAAVLEQSAVLSDRVGDRLTAEAQWIRALAVRRRLGERTVRWTRPSNCC